MKYAKLMALVFLIQISCTNKTEISEQNRQSQILRLEASSALVAKDYSSVQSLAKQALEIDEEIKDSLAIAESLLLLARASAFTDDFKNAVHFGERGSVICKKITNYPLEYKINNILSWAYFMLDKDFRQNLEHKERQLFVANQLDDNEAKAGVYNNYGYDHTVWGKLHLDTLVSYSRFANDYYAKTENNQGRWYTLMNLTWQYRLKGNFKESEYYGNLSVRQAKIDKDRHAVIEANTNLGETLLEQDKIKEAIKLYEDARKWSLEQNDRDKFVFDVYYSKFLWKKGKKVKALDVVENAVEFLKSDEVFYEMLGRSYLAEYSYYLNDLKKVEEQIAIFKSPRSNYISLESKITVFNIEALILAQQNREEALNFLNAKLSIVENIGAKSLAQRIKETIMRVKGL